MPCIVAALARMPCTYAAELILSIVCSIRRHKNEADLLVQDLLTLLITAAAGARAVPMISPAVVATPTAVAIPVPVVEASPPTQVKLIDLLTKKTLNTFTPVATKEATPEPSVPTLKELLLRVPHSVLTTHCACVD